MLEIIVKDVTALKLQKSGSIYLFHQCLIQREMKEPVFTAHIMLHHVSWLGILYNYFSFDIQMNK